MRNVYGLRLLAQPRVQRAVLGIVAVLVLAWRAAQFIGWTGAEQWAYDLTFYWTAGSQLIHGLPIYTAAQLAGPYVPQAQDGFLYPPPVAAFFALFAIAFPSDPGAANWVWAAIGATILVASVLALGADLRLGDRYPLLAGRGRWWLVAAAFAFPPVIDELVVGNVHLLLLGLLTLAWLGLGRDAAATSSTHAPTGIAAGISPLTSSSNRPAGQRPPARLAGLAIGIAAIVKVFPGFIAAWLLVQRRWGAVAWVVVGAIAATLVALPITGLEPWRQYPTVLANLSSTPDAIDALAPTMWLTPALGFTLARALATVIGLAILFLVRNADPRLGFASAVTASVLVTPAMYTSYLTILVLPLVLGLASGVRLRWLALAYILMWGGRQPALGDLAWVVNRGFPTAGALLLLAVLVAAAVGARWALGEAQGTTKRWTASAA